MKHIKMIGLAACAAMALFAFGVGTASATTLEDSSGKHPTVIDASLVGTATLGSGGSVLDTCSGGTVEGIPSNTGSSSETVKGPVSAENLTWSGCTVTTKTLGGGELEIHHIAGTSDGTVTANTFEVTVNILGVSCVYGASTNDTPRDLGTLKGSDTTAVLEINTTVPKRSGSFICPSNAEWIAKYHVTTPTGLTVTAG